jgi:hypothetical protein
MPKRFGTPGPRLMLPTICTSVPVSGCSIEAQLLFDRLIVQADDQGRLQGEARVVAALCMPLIKTATEARVGRWLDQLATGGLIQRYASEGRLLIQLAGWWDNQGSPRRAYPSRYPAPEGWQDRVRLDGEPPPDRPHSADELSADSGRDDGAHAGASVPPRPAAPQSVSPQRAPSPRDADERKHSLKALTGEDAIRALDAEYAAGHIDATEYRAQRTAMDAA